MHRDIQQRNMLRGDIITLKSQKKSHQKKLLTTTPPMTTESPQTPWDVLKVKL